MFIAMNRFRVLPGQGETFERIWRERDSYLAGVPGFVQFVLLRGDEGEYISHSTWESREAFDAWTESDPLREPSCRLSDVKAQVRPTGDRHARPGARARLRGPARRPSR